MATVYSLVCFGGRTGKTVTFTDAGDVVNLTNHGLRSGAGVVFSNSGGALPTGLTAGTTYYAKQGADQNKFLLYPTSADAIAGTNQVTFSGTGTGTHNVKSAWMLGLADLSRWGSAGSERIYDGLVSWNSGRSGASAYDVEVCEIGEAFSDIISAQVNILVPAAAVEITTMLNGSRGGGFHFGNFPTGSLATMTLSHGYVIYNGGSLGSLAHVKLNYINQGVDGVTLVNISGSSVAYGFDLNSQNYVRRCIVYSTTTAAAAGIIVRAAVSEVLGCVFVGWGNGMTITGGQPGIVIRNNLMTKCSSGVSAGSSVAGYWHNNVAVGNTVNNWPTQPSALNVADKNVSCSGETGAAWVAGTSSARTVVTEASPFAATFTDWANNVFTPASAASPLVDSGASPYRPPTEDLAGDFRPAYNNGAVAYLDAGPYEFDLGYGPWPITSTLTLTNVVTGSSYRIEDTSDNSMIASGVAAGSSVAVTVPWLGAPRTLRIKVRKASAAPKYQPFETSAVVGLTDTSTYITQVPDTIAS